MSSRASVVSHEDLFICLSNSDRSYSLACRVSHEDLFLGLSDCHLQGLLIRLTTTEGLTPCPLFLGTYSFARETPHSLGLTPGLACLYPEALEVLVTSPRTYKRMWVWPFQPRPTTFASGSRLWVVLSSLVTLRSRLSDPRPSQQCLNHPPCKSCARLLKPLKPPQMTSEWW